MSEETVTDTSQQTGPVYTASFTTVITGIRTTQVDGLVDVVKKVDFTIRGQLEDQIFELPQVCDLADPDPTAFKLLADINESDVLSWVNLNFNDWDSIKSHIQYVLDKEVAKARLEVKPLPWIFPS